MLSTKLKEAAGNSADATLYVNDVFSTYLYTGTGATQTITNGIDLAGKGGMVWLKGRSGTYGTDAHSLSDTARGVGKVLCSNLTQAEFTNSDAWAPSSFNSNGWSISGNYAMNNNATNYASWTFRKAAKFFDVVTYTGTNAGGTTGVTRNISHSLGVTPGFIIVKRTDGVNNWACWHNGLSANNLIYLNLTNAQSNGTDFFGDGFGTTVAPTSSVFTVGTNANLLGATYVAYLYAHDTSSTGIIQCGAVTLDGTATYQNVNLGWEAQFVLTKNTTTAANWFINDNMRGMPVDSNSNLLFPNTTGVEASSNVTRPTSTGFSINNLLGGTYIYMAIRRPNKPPTSGTQVFGLNARTGTGANATVTGGQTDDVVLIKNRGSAVGDLFASRLTGTGYLETSSTAAEVAAGTTILQANPWDVMDGVKVGTTSTITNASANTFINYLFKRAPGFFDVVCYTGTGSATTQAHNLGVVPELMIVKNRSVAGYSWVVYDVASGNTKAMLLNTTGASTAYAPPVWNDTSPTATVFSVGTSPNNNTSGATYVAYLFATLAGISKVGSYTGNGTGQAIACGFSAGARFVLIKRTDSTGNWYTFDSARGLTSGSSPYLLLNSTAAETTGNNGVYASTGGFTLGATAITTTNIATATYIFLAVS